MNVCVSYQFHDDERRIFVIDTAKLNPRHKFESAVKDAAEGLETHVCLDGNDYDDNWGDLTTCRVLTRPCLVQKVMNLDVNFE